jgi:hypothetical protein
MHHKFNGKNALLTFATSTVAHSGQAQTRSLIESWKRSSSVPPRLQRFSTFSARTLPFASKKWS